MNFSDQQIDRIIRSMALGTHGSFARALAEAFMVADSNNQETIIEAFKGLFDRVARFHDITVEA
jgi:hypothetical protein